MTGDKEGGKRTVFYEDKQDYMCKVEKSILVKSFLKEPPQFAFHGADGWELACLSIGGAQPQLTFQEENAQPWGT